MNSQMGRKWLKTSENKPVVDRAEFEKMKSVLNSLQVTWKHFPGHKGIYGNEMADRLNREGILGEFSSRTEDPEI